MLQWINRLQNKTWIVILFGIFVWISTGFFVAFLWENLTIIALVLFVLVMTLGLPFFPKKSPFQRALYWGIGLGTASSLIFWLGP